VIVFFEVQAHKKGMTSFIFEGKYKNGMIWIEKIITNKKLPQMMRRF
jgi:hypothetical protein